MACIVLLARFLTRNDKPYTHKVKRLCTQCGDRLSNYEVATMECCPYCGLLGKGSGLSVTLVSVRV